MPEVGGEIQDWLVLHEVNVPTDLLENNTPRPVERG